MSTGVEIEHKKHYVSARLHVRVSTIQGHVCFPNRLDSVRDVRPLLALSVMALWKQCASSDFSVVRRPVRWLAKYYIPTLLNANTE